MRPRGVSEASASPRRRTVNSSPPSRASTSPSRNTSRIRSATWTRRSSPAWWPSESLTTLKRSRSRKTTPDDGAGLADLGRRTGQGVDERHPVRRPGEIVPERDLSELGVERPELPVGLDVLLTEVELAEDHRMHLPVHHDHHDEEEGHDQPQELGGPVVGHEAGDVDREHERDLEGKEVGPAGGGADGVGGRDGAEDDQVDGPEVVVARGGEANSGREAQARPLRPAITGPAIHRPTG